MTTTHRYAIVIESAENMHSAQLYGEKRPDAIASFHDFDTTGKLLLSIAERLLRELVPQAERPAIREAVAQAIAKHNEEVNNSATRSTSNA